MTNFQIGLALFAGMLTLMAFRVPIAVAMFVPGAIGYITMSGFPAWLNHLKGAGYARLAFYDLSVIPLFMLMGSIATQGGLTESLFRVANSLLGRFRGGMAMAGIVACAAFGSLCGSSVATTATVCAGGAAGNAPRQLLGSAGHCGAGCRRNTRHLAATVNHTGDLCDPD